MLAAVGLTTAAFRVSCLGINCAGVYRKILAHPKNLSWRFLSLSLPPLPQPLCTTVLSSGRESSVRKLEASLPGTEIPSPSDAQNMADTAESGVHSNTTELGLELEFDLATSTYATMFLREIAKNTH